MEKWGIKNNWNLKCWWNAQVISSDDLEIVSVKGNDYRILFWYINKDESINLMKIYSFLKALEHYQKINVSLNKGWIIEILLIKKIEKDCLNKQKCIMKKQRKIKRASAR